MHDLLSGASGESLTLDAFDDDFEKRFAASGGHDSWKLERLQTFSQPGEARWEALARGDWGEAIRLIDERRESLETFAQDIDLIGVVPHRVRIVEKPIVPYLQRKMY